MFVDAVVLEHCLLSSEY